jgi:hypothetical protein
MLAVKHKIFQTITSPQYKLLGTINLSAYVHQQQQQPEGSGSWHLINVSIKQFILNYLAQKVERKWTNNPILNFLIKTQLL